MTHTQIKPDAGTRGPAKSCRAMPIRLVLSRRQGFNLQAASRAANGLEAVIVARPSRWGNPFVTPRPPVSE